MRSYEANGDEQYTFSYASSAKNHAGNPAGIPMTLRRWMGLGDPDGKPVLAVVNFHDELSFFRSQATEVTTESVKALLADYSAGKLPRGALELKSQQKKESKPKKGCCVVL